MFTAATPQRQALHAIEPVHALVIHLQAFPPETDRQAAIPIPRVPLRQRPEALHKGATVLPAVPILRRRAREPHQSARPTLAEADLLSQKLHGLPLRGGR